MEERTVAINGKTRKIARRSLKGGRQTFKGKITKRLDGKEEGDDTNAAQDEEKCCPNNGTAETVKQKMETVHRCSRCNRKLHGYEATEGMCSDCKIEHRREYCLWTRDLHLYPGPFQ